MLAFMSCAESPWTDDEQNKFKSECMVEGGATSYCKCYMTQVMAKYPVYSDTDYMSFEEAVELSKNCK